MNKLIEDACTAAAQVSSVLGNIWDLVGTFVTGVVIILILTTLFLIPLMLTIIPWGIGISEMFKMLFN